MPVFEASAGQEAGSYTFGDLIEGDLGLLEAAKRGVVAIVDDDGMRYVLCSCDVFEGEKEKAVRATVSHFAA